MGHGEIGGGEEDFRAGSGLQIPSTWLVVAHVQHQELHRFLPCRKSMTSSPKYLVISVQPVHKFLWNYWSIYLHGIQLKQQAKLSLSTWTALKKVFHFNMKFYFWCTSCWIIFNKLKIFSQNRASKQLSVFALCAHVHAEVLVRPLKVFCRHKHLALSEAQRVPTRSSVRQPPLQVYTAYFPHFPLFFFLFNWGAYLGTRVFLGARGTGFAATPSIKPIQPPFSTHQPHDFRHTDTKPEALTINPPSWITMQAIQTRYFKHFVCKEIITVL